MNDVMSFFNGAMAGSIATFIVMYIWAMTAEDEGEQ